MSGRIVVEGTPAELKGELHGDTVQVELADEQPDGAEVHIAGVREVTVDGRWLRARADDGAAAVPGLLAALASRGLRATSVTVGRPSLDDVYLRHVGRAFGQTVGESR